MKRIERKGHSRKPSDSYPPLVSADMHLFLEFTPHNMDACMCIIFSIWNSTCTVAYLCTCDELSKRQKKKVTCIHCLEKPLSSRSFQK